MITATKLPDTLALAENPIWVSMHTNNLVVSNGSYAIVLLQIPTEAIDGNQIRFIWANNVVTFTCATTPNQSGLQFPPTSTMTMPEWLQLFADFLRTNYLISTDFDVEKNGTSITLVAKRKGTSYNITAINMGIIGLTSFSFNATNRIVRTDMKIILQIMQNNLSIHEEELDIDAAGNAQCDIAEIILPLLQNTFTISSQASAGIIKHSEMCQEFAVRFAEKYDNTVFAFSLNHNFYAIKGGIAKLDQAVFNNNATTFYDRMLTANAFLTNAPRSRHITLDAKDRLYFCLLTAHSTLILTVEYYANNILVDILNLFSINQLSLFDVIEIITDPALLGIHTTHNKYVLYLTNTAGDIVSEKREYMVDIDTYYNNRQLVFRSSIAGYDLFMLKGLGEIANDFDRNILKKALPANFGLRNFEETQANVLQTKTLTVNTGWINAYELNWLSDIFLNKEVFLLIADKLIPHIVTNKKQKQKQDDKFLYAIELELQESYLNTHYSNFNNLISPPEITISDTEVLGYGNDAVFLNGAYISYNN